jgi:uncharacterized phosphatase
MTLAIMRHGQTHYNANKRVQGQINIPLDATGLAQAKDAGNRLKNDGHHFDIIASSPLSRALESATIIRDTLGIVQPILVVERFIERDFGHLDGRSVDDVLHLFRNNDYRHETYEHNAALIRRVATGAHELARINPGKNVFAVAHSHVIKALLIASDAPTTTFGDIIKNGDIVWFEIGNGTIRYTKMEKA